MSTKLAADHEARNRAFPWPEPVPRDLAEALRLLEAHPPHPDAIELPKGAARRSLTALEKRLASDHGLPLPEALRTYLLRHDGLIDAWSGGHPLIAPHDQVEGLLAEFRWALDEVLQERRQEVADEARLLQRLFYRIRGAERLQLERFLPFGRDSSGNTFLLYVGENTRFGDPPVFKFEHSGTFSVRHSSLARYLWYRICEAHVHPQEHDARLNRLEEPELRDTLLG